MSPMLIWSANVRSDFLRDQGELDAWISTRHNTVLLANTFMRIHAKHHTVGTAVINRSNITAYPFVPHDDAPPPTEDEMIRQSEQVKSELSAALKKSGP